MDPQRGSAVSMSLRSLLAAQTSLFLHHSLMFFAVHPIEYPLSARFSSHLDVPQNYIRVSVREFPVFISVCKLAVFCFTTICILTIGFTVSFTSCNEFQWAQYEFKVGLNLKNSSQFVPWTTSFQTISLPTNKDPYVDFDQVQQAASCRRLPTFVLICLTLMPHGNNVCVVTRTGSAWMNINIVVSIIR